MVSAYNLHYDILGLIVSHLSGNDLISVALVSKALLSSVTPRLYSCIVFTQRLAKKYPMMVSPFWMIMNEPSLGVHVRIVEIHALPEYKNKNREEFLHQCTRALDLCPNLTRFKLAPNVLPSFVKNLARKERLRDLQINGSLTYAQAFLLIRVKGLRSLHLDHASWCLMNMFPLWMSDIGAQLTSLMFAHTSELNESILDVILMSLSQLRALDIRNCERVDHSAVFRLLRHTPLLECLSVTSWDNPTTATTSFAPASNLRQLTLETRNTFVPDSVEPLWSGIITHTKASNAPLRYLTLQVSDKTIISQNLMNRIIDAHADTLASLHFVRCKVATSQLQLLCRWCKNLERLATAVVSTDEFRAAIMEATSLRTLIDEPDSHSRHGISTLKHDDIKKLMTTVPTLRHIISDWRSWRKHGDAKNFHITLERRKRDSSLPSIVTFA